MLDVPETIGPNTIAVRDASHTRSLMLGFSNAFLQAHILRQLGPSTLAVSPVALGTWPMAGVNAPDVNDADSLATIRACWDLGNRSRMDDGLRVLPLTACRRSVYRSWATRYLPPSAEY